MRIKVIKGFFELQSTLPVKEATEEEFNYKAFTELQSTLPVKEATPLGAVR